MKGFPDLPPIWLAASLAAVWLLARYLPLVTAFGPLYQGLGYGLIAVSLGLIGWSALWFRRKHTTIEPHHEPTALIVEGPYRISRNPIYLALLGLLIGYVLISGALSPLPLPFLFAYVLQRRFIEPEEAILRHRFPQDAPRYFQRTRRWL